MTTSSLPTIDWTDDADAIHQWYRIIMGFDWRLANSILDLLGVNENHIVLDPFCGAGTTLVQCKKRGIASMGLDVNPVCALATKVKTNWSLTEATLQRTLEQVLVTADVNEHRDTDSREAISYLSSSGMIERGWLTLHKAKKVMALRAAIRTLPMSTAYREFFQLALISAVVNRIADIKFGPELYCLREPRRYPVRPSFVEAAQRMISDLGYARRVQAKRRVSSQVVLCDSRSSAQLLSAIPSRYDFAITSPPYPNEHDYTRSTRLELIILGHVRSTAALQVLKKRMVRCTTKGVYKDDHDAVHSAKYPFVEEIARELDSRAAAYSDGFSRLYGKMIREYFGGMAAHFIALAAGLKPGGRCAYVVRDSQSLLGVYIDTPGILAKIATSTSRTFEVDNIVEWKKVRGTTGVRDLSEKIILLKRCR